MPKITMIGAGSVVFTKNLLGDMLSYPELQDATFALHDINPERLDAAERMAQWTAQALGAHPKLEIHPERKAALEGADYIINTIQVGMLDAWLRDWKIPRKYGLQQTVADTLGIGGIFRALRTIPVMLGIAADMQQSCPQALFLNYTNPMAMLTWAMYKATPIKVVGLCHSVQGTSRRLAEYIGAPYEEITYVSAGINHQAWLLRFEWRGEDAYPLLRQAMAKPEITARDTVRFELFRRLGYFVTESSEHNAEYVPYFLKREELIRRFNIPVDVLETNIGLMREYFADTYEKLKRGEPFDIRRSHEYAPQIIHAMETDTPFLFYGNVENTGLIENLPRGCCVEVPVVAQRSGLHPCHVGELPPQLAAINRTNVNVQELAVRAALEGKREHVYHAAMLDPNAASMLSLDEIWALVDELIASHGELMPEAIRT
ncbi:MAG: alpha-glucosidase/alpha-galactosidase [Anaerolineae bacterium]|nr:alpha-glucosidase/alpha-galactosidase [Anaerolineae bacterium]